jgi:hypothetical protein
MSCRRGSVFPLFVLTNFGVSLEIQGGRVSSYTLDPWAGRQRYLVKFPYSRANRVASLRRSRLPQDCPAPVTLDAGR